MGQMLFWNADPLPQGNGIDGHIHGMIEGVFIIILNIRQPQQSGIILQDGVDGVLHEALGLSDIERFLLIDVLHHFLD